MTVDRRIQMKYIDLKRSGLVWLGLVFGLIFWILESALHVLVFEQIGFLQQIYSPEPHELWMRLTIVGMFIAFGIYGQRIVNSRRCDPCQGSLKENINVIEMRVFDNGKGISKNRLSAPQSFGIIGIRERAHSLGGSLVISGAGGEGTTVTVTIPMHGKGDRK